MTSLSFNFGDEPRDSSRRRVLGAATAAFGLSATAGIPSPVLAKPTGRAGSSSAFWPDGIRLVISVSMQFEAGAQSEHHNGSPFPPIKEDLPDLPARTRFEYGWREGIPRMLDLWDRHGVKVTSHMVGKAVELNPALADEIVQRGHEAAAHGQTWTRHSSPAVAASGRGQVQRLVRRAFTASPGIPPTAPWGGGPPSSLVREPIR